MFDRGTLPPYRTGTPSPPSASPRSGEGRPDRLGHRRRVGARGVAPGADRPDRLVGDDQARPRPARAGSCAGEGAARAGVARPPTAAPGLALGELLADAQDRAQPGVDGAAELPADQLVGLAGVAAPLGVADDDPRREPDQHRRARSRRCTRRPARGGRSGRRPRRRGSAVGERVADRGEADERRADDPGHAGHARPRGDRRGQLAGVGRRRVHLPVGGHDHVAHRRESCQTRRAVGAAGGAGSSSARRSMRSSARWTAERCSSSRSASSVRVASGVSRRASATSADDVRLLREPAVGVEDARSRPAAGRPPPPPLEVGRLRVEDPVELAAQRPRHLPRLQLQQRPARPDPAQERADRLGALPGHDAPAAADPPRGGQADVGEPPGEDRRLVERDDELEVGPAAGQAERAARQEAAAQPGHPAVLGGGRPVERRRRPGRPGRRRSDAAAATAGSRPAIAPSRPAASAARSHARAGSIAASSARSAVTRSRSEPVMPCGPCSRRVAPDGLARRPQDRRRQPRRVVVVGVVAGRRRRRGRAAARARRRGGQSSRTDLGRPVGRHAGIEPVVGQDDVDEPWRRCGATSASTWSARSYRLVSPSCVATLQT